MLKVEPPLKRIPNQVFIAAGANPKLPCKVKCRVPGCRTVILDRKLVCKACSLLVPRQMIEANDKLQVHLKVATKANRPLYVARICTMLNDSALDILNHIVMVRGQR